MRLPGSEQPLLAIALVQQEREIKKEKKEHTLFDDLFEALSAKLLLIFISNFLQEDTHRPACFQPSAPCLLHDFTFAE